MDGEWENGEAKRMNGVKRGLYFILVFRAHFALTVCALHRAGHLWCRRHPKVLMSWKLRGQLQVSVPNKFLMGWNNDVIVRQEGKDYGRLTGGRKIGESLSSYFYLPNEESDRVIRLRLGRGWGAEGIFKKKKKVFLKTGKVKWIWLLLCWMSVWDLRPVTIAESSSSQVPAE